MLERLGFDVEWGVIDVLGLTLLIADLDTSLKAVEIVVGVSLIAYNAVRIVQALKAKK